MRDSFQSFLSSASFGQARAPVLAKYQVLEKIGQGGTSEVFRVVCRESGDQFALKVIPKSKVEREGLKLQVYTERLILTSINDAGVVRLHSAFQDTFFLYFLLELAPHGSLHQLLQKQGGRIPEPTVKLIARWLFRTLQRLQEAGVVHRDVKPQNIVVGQNFELKLSDFGVAAVRPTSRNEFLVTEFQRMMNPGSNKTSVSTRDSMETQDGRAGEQVPEGIPVFPDEPLVGTFKYLSPEALQSSEALASSDVWAAAVTVHQLLTGRFPFEGDEDTELTQMILKSPPRLDGSLSLSARTFLAAVLQKNPSQRLGHTPTALIDFEAILEHPFLNKTRDPSSPSRRNSLPDAPIRVCPAYWRWLGLLWTKVTLELSACRIRVVKPPDKCLQSIALGDIERVEGLHSGRLRLVTSTREFVFDLEGDLPRDWVESIARQFHTVC